jgi:3-dehydroquinate synthase
VSAQFAPTGIQTMQDKPDINCRTVPVGLGERSYDIIIGAGLLAQAGEMISSRLGVRKCAKVTLFPVEATKRFSELEKLCERLLETGVERGDLILALGGGVIGDLGGFAASIVRRGIDFVQIPTSLLAQVDSSVGGKTGINTPQGKNLVGTFYQPRLVIIDTSVLETLPERQFRAGYAEVAKYGLLGDAAFFEWLEQNWRDVFSGGDARAQAIETSCKAKAAIVEEDEREHGQRALLNLGHTFGHALEAHAGYSDRLLHGEAVAIGMALAFEFSNELELCSGQDAQRAVRHLDTVGLPTRIAQIPGEAPKIDGLMALIAQDKKMKDGIPAFILAHGIGEAFIDRSVDQQKLRDFLSRKCDET